MTNSDIIFGVFFAFVAPASLVYLKDLYDRARKG